MINQALEHPNYEGIDFKRLVSEQYIKGNVKPFLSRKLLTPSGKIELYSKKMEQDGYSPLPTYLPLENDGEFPLQLVAGPNHHFLNSTFSNNEKHISLEKEPLLHVNTKDANARGVIDGELVRIWNHRGECRMKVSVGENVLPGVVITQGLWKDSSDHQQAINSLTPDRVADMGNGATFFSGKVDFGSAGDVPCA